jgi:alpha-beta hydrolase superfamily lysophospholipase
MKEIENTFEGIDGCRLYYRAWCPDDDKAKAVMVITHGVGEHIKRYQNFVDALVPAGYIVTGYDHRGHGCSEGQRGHINCWDEYTNDLNCFRKLTRDSYPGLPIFLYGHSMGSLIVLDYLIKNDQELAGAILSGIAIEVSDAAPAHLVLLAKVLSGVLPRFSMKMDLQGSSLSRDSRTAAAYMEDPLVHWDRTARWGTEMLKVIDRIKAQVSKITLPVLIVHGECDPITLSEGAKYCYEQMSSKDKTYKLYKDCLHEPHNDLDYKVVAADIKKWLDAHSHESMRTFTVNRF